MKRTPAQRVYYYASRYLDRTDKYPTFRQISKALRMSYDEIDDAVACYQGDGSLYICGYNEKPGYPRGKYFVVAMGDEGGTWIRKSALHYHRHVQSYETRPWNRAKALCGDKQAGYTTRTKARVTCNRCKRSLYGDGHFTLSVRF